ncbi:MAG: SH3 domain-containing protein [Thermomicrobiales bacterium]
MSYQPEERYWTDYLRIALPVIGLLVLIGLLWYWASALIGDGANQPPPTPEVQAVITPINESTPLPPTPTAVVVAPTPGPPPTPTVTAAPAAAPTQPAAAPTTAAAAADAENSCADMPTYEAGTVVQTTADVNLREGPTTDSASLGVIASGTQLQISGEFSEQGQCDWWPVTTVTQPSQSGFVREDFIQAVAS